MNTITTRWFFMVGVAGAPLLCNTAPAACVTNGYALNQSYATQCAEVDNINIPLLFTNATAYRITATHPRYSTTTIDSGTPDFTSCAFSDGTIWWIGTNDTSSAEFLQTITNAFYDFFAMDDPLEGIDQPPSLFPREIDVSSNDVYIHFTANEASDANIELKIGATFTIGMVSVSTTLQLRAETWNGSGWTDQGARTFTAANLVQSWSIPDFTWLPGTDANNLHVVAVAAGSGPNARGVYDYLELRQRDQAGDSPPDKLYDDGKVIVEAFTNDFWWRAPESMNVDVVGGSSLTNAQWFRISKQTPTNAGWDQFFVLYEDGNARIIPLPPNAPHRGDWGASIILGPSADSVRPYAAISRVNIDPSDVSMDITYQDGTSNHVDLISDREKTIVDVSGISYNTSTQSFARFRSMWVTDGKADIDRIHAATGLYPIMNGWTALDGSWWEFLRDVPSYHNTYSPEYRIEVMQPSQTFTQIEAESYVTTSNGIVFAYGNASGGAALNLSAAGDEATYALSLEDSQPDCRLVMRYADIDGGDNGNSHGNTLTVYIDGDYAGQTYTVNTGGSNSFKLTAPIFLGNLLPGLHTVDVFSDAGTSGCVLDDLELTSWRQNQWSTNVIVARECEIPDAGSGFSPTNRSNASGGETLVMATNGGSAVYNLLVPAPQSNTFARIRHSDAWAPTRMDVYVDGALKAKTPSTTESVEYWNLINPGFEDPTTGETTVADGWFLGGDVTRESWAARYGPWGISFHGWGNNGYFGQEVDFSTNQGNVFTFYIDAKFESGFSSSNGDVCLQLEFWNGSTSFLYRATNNIYADLTNVPDAWQTLAFRFTNSAADANLLKVMARFGGVTSGAHAVSFDNAALTQSSGSDWNWFTNSPLLYLGDLSSGIHTVRVDTSAETFGLELDTLELVNTMTLNRSPSLRAPILLTVPVGSTTSVTVYASDQDPDCVSLTTTGAPAGSTFVLNTFTWTPGANAAGTTSTVAFTANDQRGDTNSVVTSNVTVVVPFDSDGDGMGDGWEWSSFGTLTNAPDGDADGDGIPNIDEYIAGTTPTDSGSFFRVMNEAGTGTRQVVVPTQPSRKYTIYFADSSYSNGMSWTQFANTNIGIGTWIETNAAATTHTFIDDLGPDTTGGESPSGERSYQVRVELP